MAVVLVSGKGCLNGRLFAQVIVRVWQLWHGLSKAWQASQPLPEETSCIIGIAMVDGLSALGLLAGPQAKDCFVAVRQSLHALLLHSAFPRFLLMLNHGEPDQVWCHKLLS